MVCSAGKPAPCVWPIDEIDELRLDFVDRDGAIFALSQIKPGLYWGPSGDGHHLQYIHWRGKPILVIAIGHLAGFNVIANSNNPAPRTDIKIELLRPFDVEKLRDLHDICRRPFGACLMTPTVEHLSSYYIYTQMRQLP